MSELQCSSEQLWKITLKFSLMTKCVQMWTANQAVVDRDIPQVWILWHQRSHACHESCCADCSREVMIHHSNRARRRNCIYKSCAISNTRLSIVGLKHQSLVILKCFSFRFRWHLGGNYKDNCNSEKEKLYWNSKMIQRERAREWERERESERGALWASVL